MPKSSKLTPQKIEQPAEKKKRASGAGVKPEDGVQPLDRKQIRIDRASEIVLTEIGGGNLSLGIRESARRLKEIGDMSPFSLERHNKRKN